MAQVTPETQRNDKNKVAGRIYKTVAESPTLLCLATKSKVGALTKATWDNAGTHLIRGDLKAWSDDAVTNTKIHKNKNIRVVPRWELEAVETRPGQRNRKPAQLQHT